MKKYLTAPPSKITRELREQKNKHKGGVFWLTGLSGAGKSTLAHMLEEKFFTENKQIVVLDGDKIRHGLCSDLSFSDEGRNENIRRIAELSLIFAQQGIICLCAFISPLQSQRDLVRKILDEDNFYEIFVSCKLEECERRDVKGYYALAREGKIKNYTGVSAPYEEPLSADFTVHTDTDSESECYKKLFDFISSKI